MKALPKTVTTFVTETAVKPSRIIKTIERNSADAARKERHESQNIQAIRTAVQEKIGERFFANA